MPPRDSFRHRSAPREQRCTQRVCLFQRAPTSEIEVMRSAVRHAEIVANRAAHSANGEIGGVKVAGIDGGEEMILAPRRNLISGKVDDGWLPTQGEIAILAIKDQRAVI